MKLTDIEVKEFDKYIELFNFSNFIKDKTFLVTGSKGIVGSGIIKWLLYASKKNNLNVHIIASTRDVTNTPSYIDCNDDVQYCTFGKEIEECENKKIDYIIHAASPTSNKVFISQPVESFMVIFEGTHRMLQLAKVHNAKMIYLSSEEVYGLIDSTEDIGEDHLHHINSLNTRSCYPMGKNAAECLCVSYCEEYGVDVRILRPTVILGLWQEYDSVKVEAEILRCIMENKNFVMKSDGSTMKSVIYSMDAISATLLVLFKGEAGAAYNATNPDTFCTVKDRAKKAFAEFNPNCKIEFDIPTQSIHTGYLPKRRLKEDISRISTPPLGWKPYADMSYIYRLDVKRFSKG